MRKNEFPGTFVVFDGIDGSGQTTQATMLVKFLNARSISALYTKGPTRITDAGKRIYDVLEGKLTMGHQELQALYIQDHRERLRQEIVPSLQKGTWVVSDRYMFSTIAYGAANKVAADWLLSKTESFLLPDFIFHLSISPKEAMRRIAKRGGETHKLFEKEEMLGSVKTSFETFLPNFEHVRIIKGEQSIEKVHKDVVRVVKNTAAI